MAASTHAPLTGAVLACELSGDYALMLPLLVATALAAAWARRLYVDSVYTAELTRRGLRWRLTLDGRRVIESQQHSVDVVGAGAARRSVPGVGPRKLPGCDARDPGFDAPFGAAAVLAFRGFARVKTALDDAIHRRSLPHLQAPRTWPSTLKPRRETNLCFR